MRYRFRIAKQDRINKINRIYLFHFFFFYLFILQERTITIFASFCANNLFIYFFFDVFYSYNICTHFFGVSSTWWTIHFDDIDIWFIAHYVFTRWYYYYFKFVYFFVINETHRQICIIFPSFVIDKAECSPSITIVW